MAPRVSVLMLDTAFPRLPGDIGCAQTFTVPPDLRRIARASVARIVTADPGAVDLAPFLAALPGAQGAIVTTSCGFLAPFQARLAAASPRPVIASALHALPGLVARYGAAAVAVLTFDAEKLSPAHLGRLRPGAVIGLPASAHLRRVIEDDLPQLDEDEARAELVALLRAALPARTRALVLECTNLPPYRRAIEQVYDGEIVDILTVIEAAQPGAIRADLLPMAPD